MSVTSYVTSDGYVRNVSPGTALPTAISNTSDNPVPTIDGLSIPEHDYVDLSYTGTNLTTVIYRTGGASGTVVATLTLTYDGSSNLTSITKS